MNNPRLWPTTRRRRWLLIVILLFGLALRLWLWWRTPVHQPANDEVEYLAVARDLLAGKGWRFYDTYHWLRAPLYPLWLAGSLWLVNNQLHLSALPNIAVSSFTVYLYYLLGCEISSFCRGQNDTPDQAEQAGLLTAGCAAVLLTLATFASLWMSETLFTALFVSAILVLLRSTKQSLERPKLWLIATSGVLLGLAILTRSLPLTLLPPLAIWLLLQYRQPHTIFRLERSAIIPAVVLVLATLLTVAPWTLRNFQAYGAFIAVETGLSYNMWWFNEPREDPDTIHRTLESIRNPAERADYATQKGLARLREDPAILLRKLWPNFNAVWMVKPIEDRFLLRSYYEDVPFGLFAAALIFDDALYSVIAILGLSGLVLAPWDRRKVLLGSWLLYVVLVMLLTHGEGRYRHFLFPTLLPFAAWFVVSLRTAESRRHVAAWQRWAVVAMVIACLWTPLFLRYPVEWATLQLRRSWLAQRAAWAAQTGNFDSALEWYFQATKVDPKSADIWLAIGKLQLQRGAVDQALSAFDSAFLVAPAYIPVNMHRGDALRRLGRNEEARRAFKGYYTAEDDMLKWSWQFLDPPPTTIIDVGNGLDFGYVHGMYAAEQQVGRSARWTNGRAQVELVGSDAGGTIQLTLAAPRLDAAAVDARICVLNICRDISLGPTWRTYTLIVPKSASYRIELSSPTFQPQRSDPQTPDNRTLGMIVDQVKFEDFAAAAQHAGTR